MLKVAEAKEEEFEWRWNYAERKFDKVLKKSSFKQEHQPLGGFAAKYGGFPSPPRFWFLYSHLILTNEIMRPFVAPNNVHIVIELNDQVSIYPYFLCHE